MDARWDTSFAEELGDLQSTINILRPRYLALLNSHPNPEHALSFLPQDQQASFVEVLNLPTAEFTSASCTTATVKTPAPLPSLPACPQSPTLPLQRSKCNVSKARTAQASNSKPLDPGTKPKAPNSREQLKMVQTIMSNCPDLSLQQVIDLVTPHPSQSQETPSSGVSAFTPSPPGNQLQTTKPYTWQQKQSRKDIINRLSFRGTNAQEMHLTVPQDGPFTPLFGTSGSVLKAGLET